MPPRRPPPVHRLDEAYEQELEDRFVRRMEARLDQVVDQLTGRMADLINRRHNDEDFVNEFGSEDEPSTVSARHLDRRPRESDRRWENVMRIDVPEFDGESLNPEGFIDWLATVEEVFEFKAVPEDKRVALIATRLRGRASAWWQQLKQTRSRLGKSKIVTWEKMKKNLRANFLPHNFQRVMYQRLQNLKQGAKSVDDYTTEFYKLIARNDIKESEAHLVSRYIGGLRGQIMDSVNLFDPMTISEAHQRALAFEKQSRRGGSYAPSNIGGSSGQNSLMPRGGPNPNQKNVAGGPSSSGLKCFSCGESGHRQSECKRAGKRVMFGEVEDWQDDDGEEEYHEGPLYDIEPQYEEELVDGDVGVSLVVRRSYLTPKVTDDDWLKHNIFQSTCTVSGKTESHPKPYKLQWFKKGGEVTVSKRALVHFSIGTRYKDDVWCDVVSMDACHLLLGRPWDYDRNVVHDGRANTYSFVFDGVKITLVPSKPKELVVKPSGTLLTLAQFDEELGSAESVFVLIGKEVAEEVKVPDSMVPLLREFDDVFPEELPAGLPPLHDIQHHVDLEPGAQLPNRPHYRMSPAEHEELRRQVEDLVSKGMSGRA
ncbi:hypothetical protein OSB04_019447 [Centaurea solstitialis]|uniref:CCHC-type domain-containing protein n=1 Tax=Centaurea solstitialis TaxID=347529 RepID=A0AA38WE97_9ASTR|nr:hypothetical protein OSB04_019447 [Centaurea solstitialis]